MSEKIHNSKEIKAINQAFSRLEYLVSRMYGKERELAFILKLEKDDRRNLYSAKASILRIFNNSARGEDLKTSEWHGARQAAILAAVLSHSVLNNVRAYPAPFALKSMLDEVSAAVLAQESAVTRRLDKITK